MLKPRILCTIHILWTLPLLADGAELHWIADCGTKIQEKSCELRTTDCQDGLDTYEEPSQNLTITPSFKEFFNYTQGHSPEKRWYPLLNISWRDEGHGEVAIFNIGIAYRGKYAFPSIARDQCLKLTIKREPATHIKQKRGDIITLHSTNNDIDSRQHPIAFLSIRVTSPKENKIVAEGSISLPLDQLNPTSLPACFRRIVPKMNLNRTCSSSKWTTTLVVRTSSCKKAISVDFEIAPEDSITQYDVTLYNRLAATREDQHFKAKPGDEFGTVTFRHVQPATEYYIKVNVQVQKHIYWIEKSPTKPKATFSGFLNISATPKCPPDPSPRQEPIEKPKSTLLPVIFILCFIVILTLISMCYILVKKIRKKEINRLPSEDRSPKEPRPCMRNVLFVYCLDNKDHSDAVKRLANLLNEEGLCNVFLDQWEVKCILEIGIPAWVGRRYNEAEKVVVIGSDGAFNFIEAMKHGHFWPLLETAFSLSQVFSSAVRVLQGSFSSHIKSKAIAVTFDYTSVNASRNNTLKELTGNDIIYRLPLDLERFLLSIHDVNKYECGNNVMEWGEPFMESEPGLQLLSSIRRAARRYSDNPKWFTQLYGQPVLYPDHRETHSSSILPVQNSVNQVKEPEEIDFTSPYDCAEELELNSKSTYEIALIGPTDDPDLEAVESSTSEDFVFDSVSESRSDIALLPIGPAGKVAKSLYALEFLNKQNVNINKSSSIEIQLDSGLGMLTDHDGLCSDIWLSSNPHLEFMKEGDVGYGASHVAQYGMLYGTRSLNPPSSMSSLLCEQNLENMDYDSS